MCTHRGGLSAMMTGGNPTVTLSGPTSAGQTPASSTRDLADKISEEESVRRTLAIRASKNHTMYAFRKDGRTYYSEGANPLDAQRSIETAYGISLKGAEREDIFKGKVINRSRGK